MHLCNFYFGCVYRILAHAHNMPFYFFSLKFYCLETLSPWVFVWRPRAAVMTENILYRCWLCFCYVLILIETTAWKCWWKAVVITYDVPYFLLQEVLQSVMFVGWFFRLLTFSHWALAAGLPGFLSPHCALCWLGSWWRLRPVNAFSSFL